MPIQEGDLIECSCCGKTGRYLQGISYISIGNTHDVVCEACCEQIEAIKEEAAAKEHK